MTHSDQTWEPEAKPPTVRGPDGGRACYVPFSTDAEGQPRSLTEDQASQCRSRCPQLVNDQGQRLPKLTIQLLSCASVAG